MAYDAAANLLDKRRNEDSKSENQNLIRFNQLLHFRGLQYTYDAHGRTHSKQTASGTQYYSYDAEHRLTEVRIEKQNRTERYGYVYDALGRRIEKHQIDLQPYPLPVGRAENDSGNPYRQKQKCLRITGKDRDHHYAPHRQD